jgi:hypothetical protein
MIRTAIVGAVVALIVGAATALSQSAQSIQIAVDLNTAGNSGTAVGPIDACRSVNMGDTFDFDVVVKGVPPPDSNNLNGGAAGFGLNVHFDPAVINLTNAVNNLWIRSDSPFERIAANYVDQGGANPFPATTGNTRVDYVNISVAGYSSGDGVLSRFTAKAVGPGQTTVTVDSQLDGYPYPSVLEVTDAQGSSTPYNVSSLQNALITVGQPCGSPPTSFDPSTLTPSPTPPPTPTPTPTLAPGTTSVPTPSPTPPGVPIGATQLAIDAVTTGNAATTVGQIDTCASANKGDVFLVDVIIRGVQNLLAWELPVSFNKDVLRVENRDVKMFQQANKGSNVFDTSNQTPNDSGVYFASAADLADPVSPDSGDGVLVRLTFSAIGNGTSQLSLKPVSISGGSRPDRGILLKNIDNAIIGDTTGDTFFDGPVSDAEIRVGSDCPSGARVVTTQASATTSSSGGGSSNTWVWVAIGAGIAAVAAASAAGVLYMRRRRSGGSP